MIETDIMINARIMACTWTELPDTVHDITELSAEAVPAHPLVSYLTNQVGHKGMLDDDMCLPNAFSHYLCGRKYITVRILPCYIHMTTVICVVLQWVIQLPI
jgi:hypothetical protein